MSAPRRLGLSSLGLLLAACASVDPAPRDPLDKGEWRSAKSRMYQDLAMQCLKAQDHDRAKQLLQQAIQFDQKDGQTLELLGRLAYAGGDLETASGAARMLLQLDPASVPALCTLGAVAEARHRGDEAEAHYRRALAAGGDDPRPGVDLHRLLLAAGREAEAATLRRQLTARFPRLVEATLDHAAHLAARCEWTEANAAFDEALAAEPGLANAAAGYALSAVMSRRPAAAMALGDRLPPHAHTDNPALVMTLAVARLLAGVYAAALRELDLGPATL